MRSKLSDAIKQSPLGCDPTSDDPDELFKIYDTTLRSIADTFAPAHYVKSSSHPLTPWFDADCRAARRNCRRLERRYRRTRGVADRNSWVMATKAKFELLRVKRDNYWLNRVATDGSSSARLWRSISDILGRHSKTPESVSPLTAEGFSEHFENKIATIRALSITI